MKRLVATAVILALLIASPATASHKKPLHTWFVGEILILDVGGGLVCMWVCEGERHRGKNHYALTLGNTLCVQQPRESRFDRMSVEDARQIGEVER